MEGLLHRRPPSVWQQFIEQPYRFLAQKLYSLRRTVPSQPLANPVSVVCVSDTHNSQPTLPPGDILIHAGDLTQGGTYLELQSALSWLRSQPHASKIVVAGNHDLLLDEATRNGEHTAHQRDRLDWGDIIYLENEETTVTCENGRRLRVYGSPLSPKHGNWAFQYPRDSNVWRRRVIDEDIDILVTHGPPRAHLDLRFGCEHLLRELWRVRPRLHVFGHVHGGAGVEWLQFDGLQRAYERVLVRGGLWDLMQMGVEYVKTAFVRPIEAKCLLVNAAMAGGLRDELQREATVVLV